MRSPRTVTREQPPLTATREIKKESQVAQPRPTLCDPVDCRLPGSSVHGIFQARVLEWVAISPWQRLCTAKKKIIKFIKIYSWKSKASEYKLHISHDQLFEKRRKFLEVITKLLLCYGIMGDAFLSLHFPALSTWACPIVILKGKKQYCVFLLVQIP